MHHRPIVVTTRTSPAETSAIRLWLGQRGGHVFEHTASDLKSPGSLSPGPHTHFFPGLQISSIREILEWNAPIVVIAGKEFQKTTPEFEGFQAEYFDAGGIALLVWPDFRGAVLFPEIEFRSKASPGHIFVHSENQSLKRRLRQVFSYTKRMVRADFSNTLETLASLEQMDLEEKQKGCLFVIDLDAKEVELDRTIQLVRQIHRRPLKERFRLDLLVIKDFAKPLPGFARMVSTLKPTVRRIFHPDEALYACIESQIFFQGPLKGPFQGASRIQTPERGTFPARPLPLESILLGDLNTYPGDDPAPRIQEGLKELEDHARSVPFFWLHSFLFAGQKTRGLGLASGDLFQ